MKSLDRRDFMKWTGAAFGAAAMTGTLLSCTKSTQSEWQGFNYAMCNESMQDKSWADQCQIIADAGYTGIEIAPFTLVADGVGELSATKRLEMVQTMEKTGLQCAGLHWLLAPPPPGLHFTTPDQDVRQRTIGYLDELVDFCGDLGGTVMIFGSPKQRNTQGIALPKAKQHFANGLARVADHAQDRGVKILIEPLDTSQTDVVNTLAEAVDIVKQINHSAIQTMFDFHNTPNETEPFDVLVKTYYDHIYHVHVQEMDGQYLGASNSAESYIEAFQVLKNNGYDEWVSLEVFDFSPGGRAIAEQSMQALKQIESQLA